MQERISMNLMNNNYRIIWIPLKQINRHIKKEEIYTKCMSIPSSEAKKTTSKCKILRNKKRKTTRIILKGKTSGNKCTKTNFLLQKKATFLNNKEIKNSNNNSNKFKKYKETSTLTNKRTKTKERKNTTTRMETGFRQKS